MSPAGFGLSRRRVLELAGAAGGALALPSPALAAPGFPWSKPRHDPVAEAYLDVLHEHTRWVEDQWDDTIGAYAAADFRFVAVLGNAVLLCAEDYDPAKAGVDRATLEQRTLATIQRFAATNRLAGGDEWGRQLFRDSTFELYFVLAARLLWADLDAETQANVQKIAAGQAAYAAGLGFADDPLSGGESPNGRTGGWVGDSKLAEMGVYAQAMAPGLAWVEDDATIRNRFLFWAANAAALPVADRANAAVVDGVPVSKRSVAHNIHDTFIVESHGSADPHHQAEVWRSAGRAAIHFLAAGEPLPQVLTRRPNGEQLWRTLRLLASDAGEPVLPMVADRYHLYGRDVLPLAFLAQVQGDADAARAEADLAARLVPYLRHGGDHRLTTFTDEDTDEPEARAELAISYLFHRRRGVPVRPARDFFARAAGTRDFGADVGMVVHQSEEAFAAAVTKDGFVRFLWQPRHDNWLVDSRAPGFLPPDANPTGRWVRAYEKVRDGLDATATVLTLSNGYAGFATLPTGTVVYASTGLGPAEGSLTLFNLTMPGVPGLTGRRTFTGAGGAVTLHASEASGNGGTDELTFDPRRARYVRMLGRAAATGYGYSVWTFAVLDEQGADLAQGAMVGASSSDITYPARNAIDGNPDTRWAVDRTERGRPDGWLAVDLGSVVTVAGVRLEWADAYATKYAIQTSTDAVTWTDAVVVPRTRTMTGGWVDIDGRAGLVTRGPITVTGDGVSAPARLIEGYVRADLAAAASRPLPTGDGVTVSDADGYLSVFNLSPGGVTSTVVIPSTARLYRGVLVARNDGALNWTITLDGATALVEPPRFTVAGAVPPGTCFDVTDSHHLTITAPVGLAVAVTVRSGSWSSPVRVRAGASRSLTAPGSTVTPTRDVARGRTTYPTSPLPAGMTSPARAVDGDPRTAWRPGPDGRMVVDLGSVVTVSEVRLSWTRGTVPEARLEASRDGLVYGVIPKFSPVQARYVAVSVPGWRVGDPELVELAVFRL
jgi:F5/8 type C domain